MADHGRPTDRLSRSRIGLLVNPIAGLGGPVGLKGTDGPAAERALALGARPLAGERAAIALRTLSARWPADRLRPLIVTMSGPMGGDVVGPDLEVRRLGKGPAAHSTGADTRRLARDLIDSGTDLLLFAGGDGTARDISVAVGEAVVVLGVPAGVKMQSDVFARSPAAAGDLAVTYLNGPSRWTRQADVVDLDEVAYRDGAIAPRLFGQLRVPAGPQVQGRKSPSPPSEEAVMARIAADVVEGFEEGRCYVLGPGTTTRAIAEQAGVPKTLVGIDVLLWTSAGGRLLLADGGARALEGIVAGRPASIVLTPIGGQGFLFGRGNQPLSPALLRAVGRAGLIVVATPAKLDALSGRPLLVDTGDAELDAMLTGHIQVVTGYRERTVVPVAAA